MLTLDEPGKRAVKLCASMSRTLGGSPGISMRLWHCPNRRSFRFVSSMMPAGMLRKLFLLRSNFFNEIKEKISLGIAPSISLQSLRSKFVKDLKLEKPEGKRKLIPFELFLCNNQSEKSEPNEVGANILRPGYINTWRFLKRTIESGGCVIAVPSAWSCARRCRHPMFLGKLSNCEQPETLSFSRDVKLDMPFERLTRFLHFLRFNKMRPFRRSIDEGSTSIGVPSKRSSFKLSIFSIISGKLSSFEQPERKRYSRDFNLQILVGRLLRFLHRTISDPIKQVQ